MQTCSRCGESNPDSATICKKCRGTMTPVSNETIVCSRCGQRNPATARKCKNCHGSLPTATTGTKRCPYCAETIQAAAIVCRYCGRDLAELPKTAAQPTSQKKGTNWGCILAAIVAGILLVVWLLSQLSSPEPSSSPYRTRPTSAPSSYLVKYRVQGTGQQADVTYENEQGGTEQRDIPIPWVHTLTMKSGSFVYLATQSHDDATRTITCEIWVDGELYKTSSSSGKYVIATCSGRLP